MAMAELRSSHTVLEEESAAAAAAAAGVVTCLHLLQAHLQTACEEEMGTYIQKDYYTDLWRGILTRQDSPEVVEAMAEL